MVRAFIAMRAALTDTRELARKLASLEKELTSRLDTHEAAIADVLQRVMALLEPPPPAPEPPRKEMGFHTASRPPANPELPHAPQPSRGKPAGRLSLAGKTALGITHAMLITSKGQVTIPQRIRNRHGLKPGTSVEFVVDGGKVQLRPRKRAKNAVDAWLQQAVGAGKGKLTTDRLMRLTRGED